MVILYGGDIWMMIYGGDIRDMVMVYGDGIYIYIC